MYWRRFHKSKRIRKQSNKSLLSSAAVNEINCDKTHLEQKCASGTGTIFLKWRGSQQPVLHCFQISFFFFLFGSSWGFLVHRARAACMSKYCHSNASPVYMLSFNCDHEYGQFPSPAETPTMMPRAATSSPKRGNQ